MAEGLLAIAFTVIGTYLLADTTSDIAGVCA